MGGLDASTLRRAERAHYAMQAGLYLRERRDLPGVALFHAPGIPEPEWCHAGLVALSPADVGERLAQIRTFYEERSLRPTVAVNALTEPRDLARRLTDLGFAPTFRHRWFFLSRPAPAAVALPAGTEIIRPIDNARRMHAGIDVFTEVYSASEWGGPLPAGYARALWASFRRGAGGAQVDHYLATVDGVPAAFATALHLGDACGLYNVAVLPAHRRRGLAGALTARRLADAARRGRRLVFGQTEREWVAQWYVRRGFEVGLVTVGYTAA